MRERVWRLMFMREREGLYEGKVGVVRVCILALSLYISGKEKNTKPCRRYGAAYISSSGGPGNHEDATLYEPTREQLRGKIINTKYMRIF